MEAEEPIPDFVRVFLTENVRGPERLRFAYGIENDETSPDLVPPEEVESRTPALTIDLHPSRFHSDRRR